jgi:hypothetical protein
MRTNIPAATIRRIQREARSATIRERALALRRAGWTYLQIGRALGVGPTRVWQLVAQRVAERGSRGLDREQEFRSLR